MVRKTDQRVINHKSQTVSFSSSIMELMIELFNLFIFIFNSITKTTQNPHCEYVTFETIQTYKGHKPDRTIVTKQTSHNDSTVNLTPTPSPSNTNNNNNNKTDVKAVTTTTPPTTNNKKTVSPILRKNEYSQFENECLQSHNEYRTKHGVKPLKLNKKLCKFAEEWAKIIATRGNPVHRSNSPYGENIFCAWSSGSDLVVNGREPVDNW